jgi:hypothetical protein
MAAPVVSMNARRETPAGGRSLRFFIRCFLKLTALSYQLCGVRLQADLRAG